MQSLYIILSSIILITGCANDTRHNSNIQSSTTQNSTEPDTKQPLSPAELATSKGYTLIEPVERISNYLIDGWQYVNKQAIILDSTPKKKYLVTLQRNCHALRYSEVIATTSTNRSTLTKFDSILVDDHTNNRRCYIDKLFLLKKTPRNEQDKS